MKRRLLAAAWEISEEIPELSARSGPTSLDHSHRLYRRVIAKLVTPGDNEPKGFNLTTILGIVGAFVATYLGQAIGWYGPDQGAGLIAGL